MSLPARTCLALAAAIALTAGSQFAAAGQRVYVSLVGESKIVRFDLDSQTGQLRREREYAVEGRPAAMTVDPLRQFLFAALRESGKMASFRIRPDGDLQPVSVIAAGADPAYLATDRSGRWLLSAYYVAGKVMSHAIGDDGALHPRPASVFHTAEKAHAIVTDFANRSVCAPHTGPNRIYQFVFDDLTGELTPSSPSFMQFPPRTGPRHLVFHFSGSLVCFNNEQGSSVTLCRIGERGSLLPVQTLSTLPDGFDGRNSCADLQLHPSGRFLYCSNRGHDSIARFAVDEEAGRLTALGQTPTEATPRSLALDPSGRFLIAAGQSSGRLAVYRVDEQTGALNLCSTIEAGQQPWWALILDGAAR